MFYARPGPTHEGALYMLVEAFLSAVLSNRTGSARSISGPHHDSSSALGPIVYCHRYLPATVGIHLVPESSKDSFLDHPRKSSSENFNLPSSFPSIPFSPQIPHFQGSASLQPYEILLVDNTLDTYSERKQPWPASTSWTSSRRSSTVSRASVAREPYARHPRFGHADEVCVVQPLMTFASRRLSPLLD